MVKHLSDFDQTVDLPGQNAQYADGQNEEEYLVGEQLAEEHRAGLIIGSGPSLSEQAYDTLRDRLRIASLLLGTGYAAFLILSLVDLYRGVNEQHPLLLSLHFAITSLTLLVGWRLCIHCRHLLKHLRLGELLVFGGSAVFFAAVGYVTIQDSLAEGQIADINGPWILLIFTYALLIPNSWRRAALVIIPMAVTPVLVTVAARLTSSDFVNVFLTDPGVRGSLIQVVISMTLAATIAIWGVRSIRSLRVEAFEAKKLGQYQLKRMLGKGGMGEVYLAEHLIRPDKCSDIYSLGAVAYFLLTGRPPFEGNNPMRVIMSHARDLPKTPTELNPGIPPDLERVVMQCLNKSPSDRYATVNELRLDLRSCDSANAWDERDAADWWEHFGCPEKKKLDAEVLELAIA